MQRESVAHTFLVAAVLCLVCSLLVSSAAVGLRSRQAANKEREEQKNILKVAGLWREGGDVDELFQPVEINVVDLDSDTGAYTDDVDPEDYDQRAAAADPNSSGLIPAENDVAGLKRRERYSFVYLVKDAEDRIDQVVLPIRGYGLWSTLRGFLSLDAESLQESAASTTIRGLTYYDHKETPGLGGEVDNARWKALWKGKKAFDQDWTVIIEVVKAPSTDYQVDALSGATITSRGVTNMLRFWLGASGFEPYLKRLQTELKSQ